MKPTPEITVTLSGELLRHLRGLAAALDVPLHWLVAGLVCDTVEGVAARRPTARAQGRFDLRRPTLTPHAGDAGTRRTAIPA